MHEASKAQILDALDQAGLDEEVVHWNYSGRGMYGDTCFGIVGYLPDLIKFIASFASFGDDWTWLEDVKEDNMGRQMIFYWPGVKVEDDAS